MAGMKSTAAPPQAPAPDGAAGAPEDAPDRRARLKDFIAGEARRCRERRRVLFGAARDSGSGAVPPGSDGGHRHHYWSGGAWRTDERNWALALSGGGIRSATFCLGVLQALAQPRPSAGLPPSVGNAPPGLDGLLPHFDYVSSVSGGGFVAGFMQSLFVRKAHANTSARAAYGHIAKEPPERVRNGSAPTPVSWLRENGRYLAPSGSGDLAYAVGFSVRNWIGIQLAFGSIILFLVALATLAGTLLPPDLPPLHDSLILPALVVVFWLLPAAGAYWMTRDIGAGKTGSLPWTRLVVVAVVGALLLNIGMAPMLGPAAGLAAGWPDLFGGDIDAWRLHCTASGAIAVQASAWALRVRFFSKRGEQPAAMAVTLTRSFTAGLLVLAALVALGLVWAATQWLLTTTSGASLLVSGGSAGLFAALYHGVLKVLPILRGPGSSLEKNHGLPRRALGATLSALGLGLLFAAAVFWTSAAQWLMDPCTGWLLALRCTPLFLPTFANAVGLAVLSGMLMLLIGAWSSFVNMSSYHYFYSARLTRAYLGGANPARTTTPASNTRDAASATEPHPDDDVAYADYHANPEAPLHLINITLNQTVAPGEQLVQHDRKGMPFVVLPRLDGVPVRHMAFSYGDKLCQVPTDGRLLSMGNWLAISGAAVSTGLGRQTSVGASICATFANARIGRWWPVPGKDRNLLRRLFPTYSCLWSELRGKFHGTDRNFLYLTDGGHFDNTGAYELLRRVADPASAVRFILMCDCGADPDYRYADLANLVRIARIDFGLELEVDHANANPGTKLGKVFSTPDRMGPADPARLDNRCALLLNVKGEDKLLARIIVIKPRLIRCASSDLLAFYRDNPIFPQQSTGDQFFEEEQWESYRKLGFECCKAVLSLGPDLWEHVLEVP